MQRTLHRRAARLDAPAFHQRRGQLFDRGIRHLRHDRAQQLGDLAVDRGRPAASLWERLDAASTPMAREHPIDGCVPDAEQVSRLLVGQALLVHCSDDRSTDSNWDGCRGHPQYRSLNSDHVKWVQR